MTFPRVKPGNWAVGEELTSAQMNTLDTDHANAVDKTGDTISGTIHVSGAGKVSADLHDTIVSTVDSGISTGVSHGISINNDTGLVLEGSTSWPCFRSTRSITRAVAPTITNISGASGWSALTGDVILGPATAAYVTFELDVHHGSTISTLECVFSVTSAHASVPLVLPSIEIKRVQAFDVLGVAPSAPVSLSGSGAAFFPTPANGTVYRNSALLQSWTFTANQNNVVDRTKYRYFAILTDENSTGAVSGNAYYGFRLTQTGIPNMQFR